MHIGFYASALPERPKPSGIVTYVSVMRDALMALGHDVSIVTNDEWLTPQGNIVPLGDGGASHRRPSYLRINLWSWLGNPIDFGPDIAGVINRVHVMNRFDVFEMEESFGWSAHVAARLDVPVITRLHGPHFLQRESSASLRTRWSETVRIAREKKAILSADAVTAPSARLLNATLAYYRIAPPIVRHIPNPVKISGPLECWSADIAASKRILMVGRFDMIKGADVAIKAFLVAQTKDPALELVIVGPDRGVLKSGRKLHFAEYIASVATANQASKITFLGARNPDEIAAMRHGAGMAIVPSRTESFSYGVAESMAVGAPTIATETFGCGELIEHGRNGLLVPVNDVEALAQAMLRIAGDRQEAERLGKEAHLRAASLLAPETIARATLDLYRAVR